MSSDTLDFIREETRQRCTILDADPKTEKKFFVVNTELFHFLYDVANITFNIYFRVDDKIIEFVKNKEFSKELLDQLWGAVQNTERRVDILLRKADKPAFNDIIENIRESRIGKLIEKDPGLDRKVLDVFSNLSNASQLVVRGGINAEVADRVKASAAFLVGNLMDSNTAISTLSKMVTHDPTLYDHSASVAMLAGVISTKCLAKPLSQKEAEVVAQCGLYHDVGKTCVPSAILNKPGKFTPDEFEVMKTHAALGEQELLQVIENGAPINAIAARVAGEHHERFHGNGYPKGRKGKYEEDPDNGIHLYSRIVTIADVYSALLMKRVYKPSYEPQDAIKIMAEIAGNEYDPEIFNNFLRSVVESLNEYQNKRAGGKDKSRILFFDDDGKLREQKRKVI